MADRAHRKNQTGALSSITAYFQVACLKRTSHNQDNILHTEESSLFVGLPHLMVSSAKAVRVAKYLGNISIPLGGTKMKSKEITSGRESVVEGRGC